MKFTGIMAAVAALGISGVFTYTAQSKPLTAENVQPKTVLATTQYMAPESATALQSMPVSTSNTPKNEVTHTTAQEPPKTVQVSLNRGEPARSNVAWSTTHTITNTPTHATTTKTETTQTVVMVHTPSHVGNGSGTTSSSLTDEQQAQNLLDQTMQQVVGQLTIPGSTTSGTTSQQPPSTSNAATSGTNDIVLAQDSWMEQHLGTSSNQVPTRLYGDNTTVGDTTTIDGVSTPSYQKTVSGSGYSVTYQVINGVLCVDTTGNVPSSLLPPGY